MIGAGCDLFASGYAAGRVCWQSRAYDKRSVADQAWAFLCILRLARGVVEGIPIDEDPIAIEIGHVQVVFVVERRSIGHRAEVIQEP